MNIYKSVQMAALIGGIALCLSACGSSQEQDTAEAAIDFGSIVQEETIPIIIREETPSAISAETQETPTETENEEETIVAFADRISDNTVSYSTKSSTYEDGGVKITYPEFENMINQDLQNQINENIRTVALSGASEEGLSSYQLSYETATAGQGLVSFVFRGSKMYEGGIYSINIVKTVNVNMSTGQSVRLKDYADIGEVVSDLENARGYSIVSEGVELHDFSAYLNNGAITDYAFWLLDFDADFSNSEMLPTGYSAVRDNHLVLFFDAEHGMGDYVELIFDAEL